jgi:hypothetical protein
VRFGEEKNTPGIEEQFHGLLARSLFTVPIGISRLHTVLCRTNVRTFNYEVFLLTCKFSRRSHINACNSGFR